MAFFFDNVCQFNDCREKFPRLHDLIKHIEKTHVDLDAKVVAEKEQSKPENIHLSYVLPYIRTNMCEDDALPIPKPSDAIINHKLTAENYYMSLLNYSNTETDDDSLEIDEMTSKFIMQNYHRASACESYAKLFKCPVPGCTKSYKNLNGIKYHSKYGHKQRPNGRDMCKCHCGKFFASTQGYKKHMLICHGSFILDDIVVTQNQQHDKSVLNSPPRTSGSTSTKASGNISGNDDDGNGDGYEDEDKDGDDNYSKETLNTNFVNQPFVCPISGCTKRYKSLNGVKYHLKCAHEQCIDECKMYKCCDKFYASIHGFKKHILKTHGPLTLREAMIIQNQQHEKNILNSPPSTASSTDAVMESPISLSPLSISDTTNTKMNYDVGYNNEVKVENETDDDYEKVDEW